METETNYRGMTVADGVAYVEQHYSATDIKNTRCFADLHELRDANMTLPFPEDCRKDDWFKFAAAIIAEFDCKMQQETVEKIT